MKQSLFIKRSLLLVLPIFILGLLNIVILQGGFFAEMAGVIPPRARLAAASYETQKKTGQNLRIKSLSFKSKISSTSPIFKKGEVVKVSCIIENAGTVAVGNFKSLIRTHVKEVAAINTKTLKPGQTITLEGEFSAESAGITYLACRTENDNREIAALYFF